MIRIQLNIPIYTEDEAFNLMPREQKDFDVKTNLIIAAIA